MTLSTPNQLKTKHISPSLNPLPSLIPHHIQQVSGHPLQQSRVSLRHPSHSLTASNRHFLDLSLCSSSFHARRKIQGLLGSKSRKFGVMRYMFFLTITPVPHCLTATYCSHSPQKSEAQACPKLAEIAL